VPKGRVRVYQADSAGSQQFVGEDWIDHTAKDERVRVKMGEAFDVVGERVQRDWTRVAAGLYEVEWEITLRNHKTDWEVLRATHTPEKVEAHTLRFELPVPKDGATRLTYRLPLRF
jgi:hypothetical protein